MANQPGKRIGRRSSAVVPLPSGSRERRIKHATNHNEAGVRPIVGQIANDRGASPEQLTGVEWRGEGEGGGKGGLGQCSRGLHMMEGLLIKAGLSATPRPLKRALWRPRDRRCHWPPAQLR